MAKMVISHTTWTTVDVEEDTAVDAIARARFTPAHVPGESLVDYVRRARPGREACEALLTYAFPAEPVAWSADPDAVTEEYAVIAVDGVDVDVE